MLECCVYETLMSGNHSASYDFFKKMNLVNMQYTKTSCADPVVISNLEKGYQKRAINMSFGCMFVEQKIITELNIKYLLLDFQRGKYFYNGEIWQFSS